MSKSGIGGFKTKVLNESSLDLGRKNGNFIQKFDWTIFLFEFHRELQAPAI
ncbi:hypothetical protein LEP1GSC132_2362 [Leptospira kirschneri str. 200803703]|nr:hypothetical protein LEP1GSC044_0701 [Leptospira kirschneri serovar Grippotyphosa str. RM52]EKP05322.1 hypothetical protein LEP1GSC018_1378 [Leptospira kirschneri str. 2008720114]EKQ83295.1 hypothetical protein LEP1GSC064_1138 [Leptospira kirschneri serovar Grippotyphosa str. Moskva]EKR08147.1 hypothetical protein LEP1GSC122_2279 [Leptospira kirschneri serovar Valbuzzi str. 200702274]EMK03124.1 hypothetical protein LEP1GSC176_2524 [Leptospira kirschneri str. MMD1493]EMO65804.1 hypothetical 